MGLFGLNFLLQGSLGMENMTVDPTVNSRECYDALAEQYRVQDSFWSNPYDAEISRLERELLRPLLTGPGPLLDLGCGFYPHFEFTDRRTVVAGDISRKSLIVAKNFGDESHEVQLVQFNAAALPFASSAFECAIAGGELLNHLPDYSVALAEFRRVLRPGGHLLLQVSAKWCLDTCWAMIDAFLGNKIGYLMTREEARRFFRVAGGDLPVTWRITPGHNLRVSLLSIPKLVRTLRNTGLRVKSDLPPAVIPVIKS